MADVTPADGPALGGKASASCVGMDQITVVRIDDTHIAEEHSHAGGKGKAVACYEMEYSVPAEEEEEQQEQQEEEEEEEEDGVYVIEYSNPEEEGESYQFTMSVDRSLPAKRPALKHPAAPESARAPSLTDKPSRRPRQKRKLMEEEEEEEKKKQLVSNKRGEDSRDAAGTTSGSDPRPLVCSLCPPGRSFKRASGLAVHMKHMHLLEGNKTFFCTACKLPVRTQIELDAHTKRHANQRAVFTCRLCPAAPPGYRGSRLGLRRHLEQEHPGVVPRCDVCSKGFSTLASYLADQFRHVGVSPFFCARCQIYEMTERGLSVHVRNHDKKTKKTKKEEVEEKEEALQEESGGIQPQTSGGADNADNSATDDSDF